MARITITEAKQTLNQLILLSFADPNLLITAQRRVHVTCYSLFSNKGRLMTAMEAAAAALRDRLVLTFQMSSDGER